jgi:lysophospholipase L1-like esterase
MPGLLLIGTHFCHGATNADPNAETEASEEAKATEALAGLNPRLPTLFIAGDSTAAQNSTKRPQWGWGECLPAYFNAERINVINLARGGRSSRTYLTEGWWARLLEHTKPGDWILIQFAHNDATAIDSPQARGSLPGLGEESATVTNATTGREEIVHTFGWYVRRMITEAKTAKLQPILISPTIKNSWSAGRIDRDEGRYPTWLRALAEEAGIPFVDLSTHAADELESLGPDQVRSLYNGKTHFKKGGATLHARLVALGLRRLPGEPFAPFLSLEGSALPADQGHGRK